MYSLQAEDIHKHCGSHEVLRGVSPRTGKGGAISIIGSSGLGKNTFLHCISPPEKPCAGRIRVGDEGLCTRPDTPGELCAADPRQLQRIRGRPAMVLQHFNLWSHLTVLENVIECPVNVLRMNCDDTAARARHYLAEVGLAEKVGRQYPCEFSGGQQQRVAIARALAIEPQATLFDEPTSALDLELVDEVPKVIQQLVEEGRTMVLVTRETAFVRRVPSRVIFLHQGVIEEQGTSDQVFGVSRSERLRQSLTGNLK